MLKIVRVCDHVGGLKCPKVCDTPALAARYWKTVISRQSWFDENKEHMVVLLLSTRYHVQGYSLVSIGSVNESIAHPREVFRAAVAGGAYAVIIMHNHPSGEPCPSKVDVSLTERLKAAGHLLQINVLDHVILGNKNRYYSFCEAGTKFEGLSLRLVRNHGIRKKKTGRRTARRSSKKLSR